MNLRVLSINIHALLIVSLCRIKPGLNNKRACNEVISVINIDLALRTLVLFHRQVGDKSWNASNLATARSELFVVTHASNLKPLLIVSFSLKVVDPRKLNLRQKKIILLSRIAILLLKGYFGRENIIFHEKT